MHPSRRQVWIANNWPLRILLLITTLGSLLSVGIFYLSAIGLPTTIAEVGTFVGYLAVAAALGYLVGGLLSLFILGPVYYGQGLDNGAPYQPGDQVRLLSGRHRGRVVTVYEVWSERGQVRVDLGDVERSAVKDVFGHVEVCREWPERSC